mgnify:FL=1
MTIVFLSVSTAPLNRVARIALIAAAPAIAALGLLCSCSPKKNTAATRKYQEFITRYNIHYNGDTHYKETLHDMEESYEDDFSRMLFIHPAAACFIRSLVWV